MLSKPTRPFAVVVLLMGTTGLSTHALARTCAQPLVPPSPELNPNAPRDGLGAQKTAVVLFHYDDTTDEPWTEADIRADVAELDDYFREISYGATWLEGHHDADVDVFGWYSMPIPAGGKQMWNVLSALETTAAADGYSYADYDLVFYVHTEPGGWLGQWMGGNRLEMFGWSTWVAAHEGFHAMGVDHANKLQCTDANGYPVPVDYTCTSAGYGDRYDIQGNQARLAHPNVRTKARMGWLCDDELKTVDTTVTGTYRYTLSPLESPTANQLLGVRIPVPRSRFNWNTIGFEPAAGAQPYYYIEYRQPEGVDANLPSGEVMDGVSVRLGSSLNDAFMTLLVDQEATTADPYDEAVAVGEHFTDPVLANGQGVTIRTIQSGPTFAEVEVCVGPCGPWDTDNDGVGDNTDNCPERYNPDQDDLDGDDIGDACDVCPETVDPTQQDSDGDSRGDACDNCVDDYNWSQSDFDSDGIGDVCDNCPDAYNPSQKDSNGDGWGDECKDTDSDGIYDWDDNCPLTPNASQTDRDHDGMGDACDACPDTHALSAGFAKWGCVDPRLLLDARLHGLAEVAMELGIDGPWDPWTKLDVELEGALKDEAELGRQIATTYLGDWETCEAVTPFQLQDMLKLSGGFDARLIDTVVDEAFGSDDRP